MLVAPRPLRVHPPPPPPPPPASVNSPSSSSPSIESRTGAPAAVRTAAREQRGTVRHASLTADQDAVNSTATGTSPRAVLPPRRALSAPAPTAQSPPSFKLPSPVTATLRPAPAEHEEADQLEDPAAAAELCAIFAFSTLRLLAATPDAETSSTAPTLATDVETGLLPRSPGASGRRTPAAARGHGYGNGRRRGGDGEGMGTALGADAGGGPPRRKTPPEGPAAALGGTGWIGLDGVMRASLSHLSHCPGGASKREYHSADHPIEPPTAAPHRLAPLPRPHAQPLRAPCALCPPRPTAAPGAGGGACPAGRRASPRGGLGAGAGAGAGRGGPSGGARAPRQGGEEVERAGEGVEC